MKTIITIYGKRGDRKFTHYCGKTSWLMTDEEIEREIRKALIRKEGVDYTVKIKKGETEITKSL